MLGVKTFVFQKRTLLVLSALLLVTNSVTFVLLMRNNSQEAETKKYPLIDIARQYIPQEDFIVNIQPLREDLQKLVRDQGKDQISLYFEFLNTGSNIQINNELRFYPASLVKLPSAMVAMKKIEKGEWTLDSRLVLFDQDKDERYGTLYKQPVGTSFSLQELLKALLTQSDNTAHRMIMRNLSETELEELKDSIGLEDLFDEQSEVSAKEYSRMFRSLYNSSYLNRDGSQQILQWLDQTPFTSLLEAGLAPGIVFSHKIGEDNVEKNYLDSGVVYLPNRPYMLTVMIKGKDKPEAEKLMKQIAKSANDYIAAYE